VAAEPSNDAPGRPVSDSLVRVAPLFALFLFVFAWLAYVNYPESPRPLLLGSFGLNFGPHVNADYVKVIPQLAITVPIMIGTVLGIVFVSDLWPERSGAATRALNAVSFGIAFAALVGVYSATYLQLAHDSSKCFGPQRLGHVEALYFTITTFTTTGFGDIHADSSVCRMVVATQTLVGLVLITVAIAALAARLLEKRVDG
jgi:hypothetical protein